MASSSIFWLLAVLVSAPPPDLPHRDPAGYARAVAELEAANLDVFEDPNMNPERLAQALDALDQHDLLLAADRGTRELQVEATLNFVRLQLVEDPPRAAEWMDGLIRQTHDHPLVADHFEPQLQSFYHDRLKALDEGGAAMLEIACTIRCRVFVDGRETPIVAGPLYLGVHEVWVEDLEQLHPPQRFDVVLEDAGVTHVVEYGPRQEESRTPIPASTRVPARVAPVWVEATLVTVGALVLIGGGVALSMHATCPKLDQTDCPKVFDARALGTTLVGLGGISLGAGSVMLGFDRSRRQGHGDDLQLSLGWLIQF